MSQDGPKRLEDTMRDEPEPTETVERYDTGASISVTLKRGTGTRDQDKWTIKGKGRTSGQALREFDKQLQEVEAELADRVRALQPNADESEGDE